MNASVIARAGGATARVVVRRPPFVEMWSHFPRGSERDVYAFIAGEVGDLYREPVKKRLRPDEKPEPEPPKPVDAIGALRLSRSLNYAGVHLAHTSAGRQASGADGKRYLLTFDDMLACLQRNWGAAERVVAANGRDVRHQFAGQKGVMAFKVSGWPSASGHITLWDGAQCADRDYFTHEPQPAVEGDEEQPFPDPKTTEVLLWELK